MLDIKTLRKDPKEVEKALLTKQMDIDLAPIMKLDEEIRALQQESETMQAKRNSLSKEIGTLMREKKDASSLMKEVETLKSKLSSMQEKLSSLEDERTEKLSYLPNIPKKDIPISHDPIDNVCIKEHGEKRIFDFPFKNHMELNEHLHLFDFQRGAKISGAGWPIYSGLGARLEWALIQYMLDTHVKNGFMQIIPPLLVRKETMIASGQIPKFADQMFQIKDEDYHLYLTPTAEVSLNGLHIDEILDEEELPKKYVAYTPCFRREAGAAGEKERGLIRTHQFNKVELFCLTHPDKSDEMFEKMQRSAEEILEGLNLHYRSMLLCTGDMSFSAAKTVDIEVYLPGQNRYYEVSSISNCTDFQARRGAIRMRKKGEKPELVHTLNGSGVATSRLMVALLENNQTQDGKVILPKVLGKYLENEIPVLEPKN